MRGAAVEGAFAVVCALVLVGAIAAYLVQVTRDANLGRAYREHMGREGAWKVLHAHRAMEDAQTDQAMRRGFKAANGLRLVK